MINWIFIDDEGYVQDISSDSLIDAVDEYLGTNDTYPRAIIRSRV